MENDYLLIEETEESEKIEEFEETEESEKIEEFEQTEVIDYSSILVEMNQRLENIEAKTIDYSEPINGLLANIYFVDFVAFTVFVLLLVCLVIKFFKIFF